MDTNLCSSLVSGAGGPFSRCRKAPTLFLLFSALSLSLYLPRPCRSSWVWYAAESFFLYSCRSRSFGLGVARSGSMATSGTRVCRWGRFRGGRNLGFALQLSPDSDLRVTACGAPVRFVLADPWWWCGFEVALWVRVLWAWCSNLGTWFLGGAWNRVGFVFRRSCGLL
ncbi:hypothetical protein IGI04_018919 [Brassica rapa subsp. trilocularis]|uniref:Transmembrane protein n=1 Tax=Brassica rapa subsp. trilocularis TaxID=1813537 RepID=A0ABQ7MGR9_BRACM|nr:hypothetical protein IGI04_018919 [Brassica rapa subsp. trilocularis]